MPKVKKPKTKQKQKQKQSQRVVVNINTGRKASSRKPRRSGRSGSGGSGGGSALANSGGNFVSSYQSPIPYQTPILNDPYVPSQFQNIPTITMPIQALENIPTLPTITYPTPTELQTATADVRPFGGSIASSMTPLSIDTRPPPRRLIPPPKPLSPIRSIGSADLSGFNLGGEDFSYIDPAIFSPPRSGLVSPMENPLLQEVLRKAPRKRKTDLGGYTDEQKKEYKRLQQEENRQAKFFIGREKKDLAKFSREMELEGFLRAEPPKKRRSKIEMQEARAMGLEDRPKRPVGRPKAKPFEQQKMGTG